MDSGTRVVAGDMSDNFVQAIMGPEGGRAVQLTDRSAAWKPVARAHKFGKAMSCHGNS